MKKTTAKTAAVLVEEKSLLDQIAEATPITKVITVNRQAILDNAEKRLYYYDDRHGVLNEGPIEIQVFEKGKKTRLITALSMEIRGSCAVKYDPSKFTPPIDCGSVLKAPKAVWMETTGRVEYTDTKGKVNIL